MPEPWRGALLAAIAVGALLLVLQPIGERRLRLPAARWIAWPASIWMGLVFLLLVQLLATDAALWLAGSVARAAGGSTPDAATTAGVRAALVAGVAGFAGLAGLWGGLRPPASKFFPPPGPQGSAKWRRMHGGHAGFPMRCQTQSALARAGPQ